MALEPPLHGTITADGPVVTTRRGPVRGRAGGDIVSFTGIAFGQPPVGSKRFAPASSAGRFHGVFDATRLAATPFQPADPALQPRSAMSEDCLQLNVWAPNTPGPHPVFVWVYGGGNRTGASNFETYDGEAFARSGVVCVTLNYRVGVFGFLELGAVLGPAYRGSANSAVHDQLLALRWVRENIARFGGDARNVTIGGQSAGAWNCATLMSLPATQGLIHRAILASGGAETVASVEQADGFAKVFVEALGSKTALFSASAETLLDAQQRAVDKVGGLAPFRSVVDGRLLTAPPLARIRAGAARRITTLTSHTHDEFRYVLAPADASLPTCAQLLVNLPADRLPAVDGAYRRTFPDLPDGERHLRMMSAEAIVMPVHRLAEAQVAAGAEVYYYTLNYAPSGGPFGGSTPHGADVPLIFDNLRTEFARKTFGYGPLDRAIAQTVHSAWVSFIKTGAVTTQHGSWPKFSDVGRSAVALGRTQTEGADPDREEARLWRSVIPAPV